MNKNTAYILKTGCVAGLNSIFELFFLYILSLYISLIILGGINKGSYSSAFDNLNIYIHTNITTLFLITITIRVCTQIFALKYISSKIGIIIANVRKTLFNEILEQDASIKFTYILENNITKINALTVNFIPALVNVISEVILLIVLISGFIYISQQYIALALIPIALFPLYISAAKSSKLGNNRRILEDNFLSLYDYLFHSRVEILALGKINNVRSNFNKLSNDAINQISKHYIFSHGPRLVIELIVSLMLFIIGILNINAQNNLIIFLIVLRIFPVLTKINGFLNQISYSYRIVGSNFLLKYLFLKINGKEDIERVFKRIDSIEVFEGEIQYKENCIKKIEPIKFKSGQLNIIKGRSGVGKTSFIYSLLGYGNYKLSRGLSVNGINVSDLSYFTVGLYLNGGNKVIDDVINYVACYDKNLDLEKINSLLNKSNITDLLEPGASKRKFSSGELQRLDLVRVLYNPTSLYIFDEPTSNLDLESFKIIDRQLRELSLTSLVIIVTHDNRFNLDDAVELV